MVMIRLCDIGNTSLHFYDGKHTFKESVEHFDISTYNESKVYYINVNTSLAATLEESEHWINLEPYVDSNRFYQGMGIDRVMACEAVDNAIIIDAGTAITVDIMDHGVYRGGFIYPGIASMYASYRAISPRLDHSFNFELDLDKMPNNTQDSISYGFLRLLYGEVMRHKKDVVITGGDARQLQSIFRDATVDELLIFKGMEQMISKRALC